jgi:curli biogenesis system outer membrane secretion channel CsgG
MKKYIIFGFAATVLLGCGTSTNVRKEDTMSVKVTEKVESKYTGPRRRVAVVDFENKSKYGARIGASASDILLTELGKSGKFILVERQKLGKIIDEQKLGQAGIVDPNTAAQVGRVLGLNAIITGSLEVGVDTVSSGMLITAGKKTDGKGDC